MSEKPVSLVEQIREGYKCESPIPEERGPGSTEWMACGGCWPCLALQAAQGMEQAKARLQAALEHVAALVRWGLTVNPYEHEVRAAQAFLAAQEESEQED